LNYQAGRRGRRSASVCHLPADAQAVPADLGACLHGLIVESVAALGAVVADVRAHPARLVHELGAAEHEVLALLAYVRAIAHKADMQYLCVLAAHVQTVDRRLGAYDTALLAGAYAAVHHVAPFQYHGPWHKAEKRFVAQGQR